MFEGKSFTDFIIDRELSIEADAVVNSDRRTSNPLQRKIAQDPSFQKRFWFGFALTHWSHFELILWSSPAH
jgi:hypothetical protein